MTGAPAPPPEAHRPLVSIVTPSLNSGAFIAETIESVLSQDYPCIEYIVMDGGSTDETAAIADSYGARLRFISQPDGGAADAINKGFQRSNGQIFAWLSADDAYLPGAVATAVSRFLAQPDAGVVYGEGYWTDEKGSILHRYPTRTPYTATMFGQECCVCQPACFIRREAFAAVGMLQAQLQSAFDYDLWIRLSKVRRFSSVPDYLATSRMHKGNKTLGARRVMFEESMALLRRHYGYVPLSWVYGYLSYLRDGSDQFFQPLRRSPLIYLASLAAGSYYNHRRLANYWAEWASRLLPGAVKSSASRTDLR